MTTAEKLDSTVVDVIRYLAAATASDDQAAMSDARKGIRALAADSHYEQMAYSLFDVWAHIQRQRISSAWTEDDYDK